MEAHHVQKMLTSIHEHKGKHEEKIEHAKGLFEKFKAHQKKLEHYDENHEARDDELKGNIAAIQEELKEARKKPIDAQKVKRLEKNLKQARHKRAEHIRHKKTVVRIHLHDVLHAVGLHTLGDKVEAFHKKLTAHDKAQKDLADKIENGTDTEADHQAHKDTHEAVQAGVSHLAKHIGQAIHGGNSDGEDTKKQAEKKQAEQGNRTSKTLLNIVDAIHGLLHITIEFK